MNARRSCRGFPTPTCLVLVSRPCRKERAQAWDSVAKAAKESVPAPGQDQIAARYRQFATLCLRSRRYLTLPISSQQAPSPSATSSRPQSRAGSRRVGVAKNLRAPRHATVGDVLGEAMELHGTSDDGRRDGIYNQREHGRRGSLSRAAPRITYRDEPGVYLALVTETPAARANKVSHLWLHEVLDGSDLYIMDPWNRGESKTPIRKVAEPLSSVEELLPAEAGQALAGEALRFALDAIRSEGATPARGSSPAPSACGVGHAQTRPPPPPLLAPPPPPPLSTARPPPALPAPPPPLPPPRPLAPPRMRPLAVLLAPPRPVRLPSPQKLGSASRGQS